MQAIFSSFSNDIIEEIARKCPQIKTVIDVNIEDIHQYSYEYPTQNDYVIVEIKGLKYYVSDPIFQLNKLTKMEECQILGPSKQTVDLIYELYQKIKSNDHLLNRAKSMPYFNNAYIEHQNGNKCFTLMDQKNSVVATMLFYLYH